MRRQKEIHVYVLGWQNNFLEHNGLVTSLAHNLQDKQLIWVFPLNLEFSSLACKQCNFFFFFGRESFNRFPLFLLCWWLWWAHTSAILLPCVPWASIIAAVVDRLFQVSWGWMEYKWSLPNMYEFEIMSCDTGLLSMYSMFYSQYVCDAKICFQKKICYLITQIFKNAAMLLV